MNPHKILTVGNSFAVGTLHYVPAIAAEAAKPALAFPFAVTPMGS